MKENFKIHPGFQKKLEVKNITHIGDEDQDYKVTKSTKNKNKVTLSKLLTNKMPKNFLELYAVTAMAPRKYYPNTKLQNVCFDRSTIYNKPAVKNYLKTQLAVNWHIWWMKSAKYRPYFMSLRKLLFVEGRSEECHTRKQDKLLRYLNCALLRHMRMEYLIPMYPLHQIYFHDKTTTVDFILYH
ncbi:hypothetical protein ACLKA6_012698 [Drosophila palustris]